MIFVEHLLGLVDNCTSVLVDFDSPTTFFPNYFMNKSLLDMWELVELFKKGKIKLIRRNPHPKKKRQCWGWSLMMWKVLLLASHSRTASSSRWMTRLSESLDRSVSTMSSNKGNWCNWITIWVQLGLWDISPYIILIPNARSFRKDLPNFDFWWFLLRCRDQCDLGCCYFPNREYG
jgi:hypothetical protein